MLFLILKIFLLDILVSHIHKGWPLLGLNSIIVEIFILKFLRLGKAL
jgi:hypothetical protein